MQIDTFLHLLGKGYKEYFSTIKNDNDNNFIIPDVYCGSTGYEY